MTTFAGVETWPILETQATDQIEISEKVHTPYLVLWGSNRTLRSARVDLQCLFHLSFTSRARTSKSRRCGQGVQEDKTSTKLRRLCAYGIYRQVWLNATSRDLMQLSLHPSRIVFAGLMVKCSTERSQMLNRAEAVKRLKEKLTVIAQDQAILDFNEIKGDQVEATFGQQIRNYVFSPYKLVKDTRTAFETSQVQDVMDGKLDDIIAAYLRTSVDVRKSHVKKASDVE
jgi:hypothetical protein